MSSVIDTFVLYLHWCEVEMWGCDKLEQNMNVFSQSQCLKKHILHEQKNKVHLYSIKCLTVRYSIHKAEKK